MENQDTKSDISKVDSSLSVPQKLSYVFFGFIVLAMFFSLIYWICYRYDENSFFFNEQITHSRKLTILGELQADMELHQRRSSQIGSFAQSKNPKIKSTQLVTNRAGIRDTASCVVDQDGQELKIFLVSGTKTHLACATIHLQGGEDIITYAFDQMKISSPFASAGINDFGEPPIYQMVASKIAELEKQEANQIEKRIERFSKKEEGKWGYFDFLYFSVTSTTGGGYGDVFPATTWTRVFVMSQMIINLFFLGVAFNIASSGATKKTVA